MTFSGRKISTIIAWLTLFTGVSIGIAALSAPLGIWLGIWDFRAGFNILGGVYPFTGWIGLGCLAIGFALLVAAKKMNSDNGIALFNLAAAGALASGIAWYIPSTFQAPEGQSYPPIHDVSTDLVDIPEYVAVMPLRADAPNTTVYGGSPRMTPERNAQLQQEAFPDLVPQYYDADSQVMFERAIAAVDAMGWDLVDAVPEEGRIEATATTFWFRFKDDVVIRIREDAGQTRIDARSLSRVGGGDAGTNAKRLMQFFEIL